MVIQIQQKQIEYEGVIDTMDGKKMLETFFHKLKTKASYGF
jgi:hypothetical protein